MKHLKRTGKKIGNWRIRGLHGRHIDGRPTWYAINEKTGEPAIVYVKGSCRKAEPAHCIPDHLIGTLNTFRAMRARCFEPSHASYAYYSTLHFHLTWTFEFYLRQGHTFHEANVLAFAAFVAAVGVRPAGTTIDRINSYWGYYPNNVRWADKWMQRNNRRFKDAFARARVSAASDPFFNGEVIDAGIGLPA